VDDVIDAFLRAGAGEQSKGQIYNLGGDEPISLKSLAELLIELAGQGTFRLVPFPAERKRIDVGDVHSSYTRIRDDVGWRPKTSLREGLSCTIDYYRKYREHYWR
jgi:UDP-glucose 4-epimerase